MDDPDFEIWVPGSPAPQGSKKHVGNGRLVESSKYLGPWRQLVAATCRCAPYTVRQGWPITGGVATHLAFVLKRPLATPKRAPTPLAIKQPDGDKLERGIFDALTMAGVWKDDSQAVQGSWSKRIAELGEPTGVLIQIKRLGVVDLAA